MSESRSRRSGIPAEALARFTTAEGRLYPTAVLDPEAYEHALRLCSLLLVDLRSSCPDIEAVLQRRERLLTLLPLRAAAAGLSLRGFEPETLVDAASAVRCRELGAHAATVDHEARVAAARAAGQEWLVEEPDPAAVMAGFYRRVELHVPSGTVLVGSVEADSNGGSATYRLEIVPGTAELGGPDEPARTFADRDEWLRAVEHSRSRISAGS